MNSGKAHADIVVDKLSFSLYPIFFFFVDCVKDDEKRTKFNEKEWSGEVSKEIGNLILELNCNVERFSLVYTASAVSNTCLLVLSVSLTLGRHADVLRR